MASKKLSTYEFTNSALLMTLVSGPNADKSKTLAKILETVKKEHANPDAKPTDLIYEITVSVNGVPTDWRDFAAHINETLDEWVAEEAGKLVKELLNPGIFEEYGKYARAVEHLSQYVQREAAKILGVDPEDV